MFNKQPWDKIKKLSQADYNLLNPGFYSATFESDFLSNPIIVYDNKFDFLNGIFLRRKATTLEFENHEPPIKIGG